jgi:hypothetical protein
MNFAVRPLVETPTIVLTQPEPAIVINKVLAVAPRFENSASFNGLGSHEDAFCITELLGFIVL